jgi:hypothetical protein
MRSRLERSRSGRRFACGRISDARLSGNNLRPGGCNDRSSKTDARRTLASKRLSGDSSRLSCGGGGFRTILPPPSGSTRTRSHPSIPGVSVPGTKTDGQQRHATTRRVAVLLHQDAEAISGCAGLILRFSSQQARDHPAVNNRYWEAVEARQPSFDQPGDEWSDGRLEMNLSAVTAGKKQ